MMEDGVADGATRKAAHQLANLLILAWRDKITTLNS